MAETVKKTKAPAKPKSTTKKAAKVTGTVTSIGPSPEEIARLAHRYWAERGFAHGAAVQDWLRAEQELRGKAS
jgi:hypothetical protein